VNRFAKATNLPVLVVAATIAAGACADRTASIRLLPSEDAGAPEAATGEGAGGRPVVAAAQGGSSGTPVVMAAGGCDSEDDCAPFGHCYKRTCVECTDDDQCRMTHLCDPQWHLCRPCVQKSDCHGTTPICDPSGRCVQCESPSDCSWDEACEAESHTCRPACHGNSDCAGSNRPICAKSTGVCVECTETNDCLARDPSTYCDQRRGRCIQCESDAECPNGWACGPDERCAPCYYADCNKGMPGTP
jgi:hypothetical protein